MRRTNEDSPATDSPDVDDVRQLRQLGYRQELARCLSGFSNYAISLSTICILSGGLTSFHIGFCSVGGAAIGLGWPLVCLFSLAVAATMGQVASAFPTAGGLYHWSAWLGGRGWGWTTAWFNLAGLVTVLAAINVGTVQFLWGAFGPRVDADSWLALGFVAAIAISQAVVNHLGMRLTARLIDFSGYWIMLVAAALTISLLIYAPSREPLRLITFANYSGLPAENPVWPTTTSWAWLFALAFLLPAYTVTGFDASAHAAEETHDAAYNVPRGILRSVLVSGVAGWIMLSALVLAVPEMDTAAGQGSDVFFHTLRVVLPAPLGLACVVGIGVAQYLCGLATMTSASRTVYAFARDGGLPGSARLRHVSSRWRTPVAAVWSVAIGSVLFALWTPVYSTITAVCTILLYISYILPTAIGWRAYGRTWTQMGPWRLGFWYRPLAAVSVLGCLGLVVIGMQPPNEKAWPIVVALSAMLVVGWYAYARRHFPGPPHARLQGIEHE